MYVRNGGNCARGRGRQLQAVRIRGGGDKFALIGYSETQWVRAVLAGPSVHIYFTTEIHISIQTFIFQEKTGLDAKAFSGIYKSFRVCRVEGYQTTSWRGEADCSLDKRTREGTRQPLRDRKGWVMSIVQFRGQESIPDNLWERRCCIN